MNEKEKNDYLASLKNHTDRELLELQTYYARKTTDHAKSTNGYVFVFFCLTIVSMIIGLFIIIANAKHN